MNRLMLCAGRAGRPGWVTLDSNEDNDPHILARIPPLPMSVTCEKWDEVELIHGITSFYPWEAKELLVEIRGCLAPGGKLVLEQPDLVEVLASIESGTASLSWLFGDPQFQNPAHMNKWSYSPATLRVALEGAGFSNAELLPAQHHNPIRDFRMEAWV